MAIYATTVIASERSERGNPQETLANIIDCHEFATQNKRSEVSLVIQNQTRLTQKIDCHDLTSSSLAMTDKDIDCHARFARSQ
ncbi:hypothetical protein [Helicobacter sp. MIT 01-3238]|uniref:hypothetical protein n=1 Tax=Helicobacter sp. MIT 01-3238 TaxID=398627 RepID=UPI0011C07A17|nr:hypothetical protein [Helicobacter sp. MIT 01-3238]